MTDYYVRPQGGGPYGAGNGLTYADAWEGAAGVQWSSLGYGHTLYICGHHAEGFISNAPSGGGGSSAYTISGGAVEEAGSIEVTDNSGYGLYLQANPSPGAGYTEVRDLSVVNLGTAPAIRNGNSSNRVRFYDVLCWGLGGISFQLQAAGECSLYDCHVYGEVNVSYSGSGNMFGEVMRCVVNCNGDQGLAFQGGDFSGAGGYVVNECEIYNWSASEDGMDLFSGQGVTIENCWLHDGALNGIKLGGTGGGNNIARNNYLESLGGYGIANNGGDNCEIYNNQVYGSDLGVSTSAGTVTDRVSGNNCSGNTTANYDLQGTITIEENNTTNTEGTNHRATIISVNNHQPIANGSTITIACKRMGAVEGNVTWGGVGQPIVSWSDTSISVGPMDGSGVPNGAAAVLEIKTA